MKLKFNFVLCIALVAVVFLCGFGGYLLADNINLNRKSEVYTTEKITDKYEASAMIMITFSGSADTDVSPDVIAENVKIVLLNSSEIIELIPAQYSVSVEPTQDAKVYKIVVTGGDSKLVAQTANAIRDKAPEVFSTYYTDGEAMPIGTPATEGTHIVEDVLVENKDPRVSPISYSIIGTLIGISFSLIIMIIDTSCRYKAVTKEFSVTDPDALQNTQQSISVTHPTP